MITSIHVEPGSHAPLSRSLRQAARVARWIQALGWLAALVALAANVYVWSSPQRIEQIVAGQLALTGHVSINAGVQATGFSLTLLPLGVGLYALLQIRRLCSALSSASVFGEQLTGALRRLALALLGLAICEVFVHTAHSVVLTYFNAPGQRMLLIGISSDTMLHVVVALLILALAAVLREASNIVAEHRQFV